ncbi:MAG: histidine kinase [Steroidobacteraceae bacterium]
MNDQPESSTATSYWPSLGILTGYWVYVTLSNILYANSMNAGFDAMSTERYFASWDVRVAQHAMLYPALAASVWASLKIRWRPLWGALPLQLLIATVFAALGAPALVGAQMLLGEHEMTHMASTGWSDWISGATLALWLASATSMLLAYGFGVALVTGFSLFQRYTAAQLQVAALEREFSSARLAALRMQLSPHTLFNLLHAIHGQIAWEPKAAQAMIVKLGDLLRRLLKAGERDFSTLADEMQFVRLYLDLQQQRFADRLSVLLPMPESLPAVWVPSLILQPLVENAVVHGLAGHGGPVTVRIEAQLADRQLILRVVNTAAAAVGIGGGEGIGTRNVRERLAVQFGARATFVSRAAEGGVWCAEILLPELRDAGASAS